MRRQPTITPTDPGLDLIAAYEHALIATGLDRLTMAQLTPTEHDREAGAIRATVTTIGEQMKREYPARTRP